MSKKTLIAIALLIWPMASLLSAEKDSKTFQIMVGLTGGVSKLRYDDINRQLAKYHQFNGLSTKDNPYGLEGLAVYKNKVILSTSVLLFAKERREKEDSQQGVSLSSSSVEVKTGLILAASKQNVVFPYLGLGFAAMRAKSNYPFIMKNPGGLFHSGREKRVVSNLALIYGIGYTRLLKAKYGFGIGLEIGGRHALTDHLWYTADERPLIPWYDPRKVHALVRSEEHVQFDPGSYFARVNIYVRLF